MSDGLRLKRGMDELWSLGWLSVVVLYLRGRGKTVVIRFFLAPHGGWGRPGDVEGYAMARECASALSRGLQDRVFWVIAGACCTPAVSGASSVGCLWGISRVCVKEEPSICFRLRNPSYGLVGEINTVCRNEPGRTRPDSFSRRSRDPDRAGA